MKAKTFKLGAKFPIYAGEIDVKSDPASSSGKLMIPPYATSVELIAEKEGYQRYFKDGAWQYVADNVGTEFWLEDGSHHTITELGEDVPEDALLEEPIIPPTVDEQTAKANTECTRRINTRWNQIGQINAALGVYGDLEAQACAEWIASNRAALLILIERPDLVEIDVTDDEHWPS